MSYTHQAFWKKYTRLCTTARNLLDYWDRCDEERLLDIASSLLGDSRALLKDDRSLAVFERDTRSIAESFSVIALRHIRLVLIAIEGSETRDELYATLDDLMGLDELYDLPIVDTSPLSNW